MSFSDLPLISDLLETKKCQSAREGSPCTCKTEKSKPDVEDNRLKNWQEWMQKRKKVHQRLGQLLKRDPGTLVMNSFEEHRALKEKKYAMEYTKIPEPDKQRGCPSFWKMPLQLIDECGEETYCFGILPKEEKCKIPIIEHVGLSNQVMEEKDVLPRVRNCCTLWEKSTYVKEKTEKLGPERMNLVDPYKPDFSDLIIKGSSLDKSKVKSQEEEKVSEVNAFIKENVLQYDREHSSISLLINDLQISPDLDITGTRKVYVVFDYDTTSGKVATEYLTIKNEGTVTIRFCWKATERPHFFKDIIPEKKRQICFYFNKNEDLVVPGQTLQLPIWFETKTPGTYYESFELCTKPAALPTKTSLVIILHATAVVGDLEEKMEAIRERLNNNIRDTLIKESLSAVMSNVPYNKFKPTVYSYNKKEVFEAINSKFDPFIQRPKYLYNKNVVRELQKFYKKVRRRSDPKCWNYSIEELRHLTIARQRKEEQLKRLADQKEAEIILACIPKFPPLGCEKNVFPAASVENIKEFHITADSKSKRTDVDLDQTPLAQQLEMILAKLEHPMTEQNLEQNKYAQVYLILCTCFDKVSEEFEILKDRLGIIKKTRYPKFSKNYVPSFRYKPTRLIHEILDDVFEKPPLRALSGTIADKPPAEIIRDIPITECKRRYRTYYNIPDTPPPTAKSRSGKGKGKGKDKKSKSGSGKGKGKDKQTKSSSGKGKDKKAKGKKGESKTSKLDEEEEDDGYVVNETFDPYAITDLPPIDDDFDEEEEEELGMGDNIDSNFDDVLPAIRRQYKYNMYVIMYNNLDKAISNIIDTIEMLPKEKVPYAVIKEIEEPKYNRRLIDLKALLVQEKVDKLKAKLILYNYRKNSKLDWKTVEMERQIKAATSESSLWSILKPYEAKPIFPDSKPISYPIEHYEEVKRVGVKSPDFENKGGEIVKDEGPPVMLNVSTSTLEGGILDPTWQDFKEVGIQKDYGEQDEHDDLEAYVEKVISEISLLELHDYRLDKATQKDSSEYVSDEEYFFQSEDNGSSIDSEQEEASCSDLFNESKTSDECTSKSQQSIKDNIA